MKTEVSKSYKWGYILSEQDLRRIIQTGQEHITKLNVDTQKQLITAKLRDGSIVESADVNEIISLENDGSKAVQRLTLIFNDGKEESEQHIEVQFQDGWKNSDGWTSINYKVVGQSRDWAFIASSEIEERVKKTKITSYAYVVNHKWFFMIPFIITIIALTVASNYLIASTEPVELLEAAYRNGEVHNPIEAIIFLEKAKSTQNYGAKLGVLMIVSFLLPFVVVSFFSYLAPRLLPSYVFYWGDNISLYNKRRNMIKIFWTVIVLGLIVSLVAGILQKAIGI